MSCWQDTKLSTHPTFPEFSSVLPHTVIIYDKYILSTELITRVHNSFEVRTKKNYLITGEKQMGQNKLSRCGSESIVSQMR